MKLPKALILVRHAESEGNLIISNALAEYEDPMEAVLYAQETILNHPRRNDWAITTARGVYESRRLVNLLEGRYGNIGFDAVYVSGLRRAQETCVLALPNIRPIIDERLNEIPGGLYTHLYSHPDREIIPREIIKEHLARRDEWLNDILSGHADEIVCAFSHAAWIASLIPYPHPLVDMTPHRGKLTPPNASITVFKCENMQSDIPEYPCNKLVLQEYGVLLK